MGTQTQLRPFEADGKWCKKAPMSSVRSHMGAVAYQGRIYVFGGGGEAFKSLNLLEIYDPLADTWSAGCPMPTTRSGVVAVALDDRIYVMGGGYKKPDGTFNFLTTVEIYDPGTDTWEKGPDLLMRHDAPAATVWDGRIYLFGGHHPEARGGPLTDPATNFSEVLDLNTNRWERIPPMPTPRFSLASIALEGKIFAMGGSAFRDEVFRNYDLIELFDPIHQTWEQSHHFSLPWPSAGPGGCVWKDKIYVFGGNNGERIQNRGAFYHTKEKAWVELPSMGEPRAAMGLVILEGTLFALGGRGANNAPVNTVEALRLEKGIR
jgi:N-acetylneuraminic acid mutarotase